MNTAVALREHTMPALPVVTPEDIEKALTIGDLSKMPPDVRIRYYLATCQSAGLNPMTQPFTAIKNQAGQVILYANATCAEQLRKRDRVSVKVLGREKDDGVYIVTVSASTPDGRCEESQGIVDISGLKGTALANAMMKAETKAKRRVTMALCGLGFPMDDDAAAGQPVTFNPQTGEIPLDDPLTVAGTLDEPHKGLHEHIADLYGEDRVSPLASAQYSPVGREITTLLLAAGLNATAQESAWQRWQAKYPDLTPAVLAMIRDGLAEKLARPVAHDEPPAPEEDAPSLWAQEEAASVTVEVVDGDIPF